MEERRVDDHVCDSRSIDPVRRYDARISRRVLYEAVAERECVEGADGLCGVLLFAVGFTVMMALDVALG